jgi:hypothetical protein
LNFATLSKDLFPQLLDEVKAEIWQTYRGVRQTKEKIRRPKSAAPRRACEMGMENAMCFSILEPTGEAKKQFAKELCNYEEDSFEEWVYLLVYLLI